jgi:RNA polymerase subunit RPABC4/transcription elongation factor Spt4
MDFGSLLLGFALFALTAFVVAGPFFEKRRVQETGHGPADPLLAERESVLTALRDLDFDHATGKITDEDYAPQRAQLVAQGAHVLRQLDALGAPGRAPAADSDAAIERAVATRRRAAPARSAQSADDLIEAQIAARRKTSPARDRAACPHCGALANAGDRFCPSCGKSLSLACPRCARPVLPADRFCAACGANLQPAEAAG